MRILNKNKELTFQEIEHSKQNTEMWGSLRVAIDMEILSKQHGKTIFVDFVNKRVVGTAPHDLEDDVIVSTAYEYLG